MSLDEHFAAWCPAKQVFEVLLERACSGQVESECCRLQSGQLTAQVSILKAPRKSIKNKQKKPFLALNGASSSRAVVPGWCVKHTFPPCCVSPRGSFSGAVVLKYERAFLRFLSWYHFQVWKDVQVSSQGLLSRSGCVAIPQIPA